MSDTNKSSKYFYPIRIIITLLLVLIVYSNTIHHPFHYDDIGAVVKSNLIEGSLSNFWKNTVGSGGDIFLHRLFLLYSFALNYHWGEGSVISYHLINIIFHLLNSLLIYLILTNIISHNLSFNKQEEPLLERSHLVFVPFLSSLIFAVHPLNTETVTFISSRSSGMSTFFFLLSFYFFIQGTNTVFSLVKAKNKVAVLYYIFSLLAFFIGLGTKEIIATLPIVIILYLYYFVNREKSLLKFLLKFRWYLATIIFPAIIYLAHRKITSGVIFLALADEGLKIFGRYYYFLTELKVIILYYLRLFIFPINLNIYPMMTPSTSLFEFPVFISLLIIICLITFAVSLGRGDRQSIQNKIISFAILWFFITLLPSSSFIPLNDPIAEHRTYLPALGASMFFGAIISIFIISQRNHVKFKLFKTLSVVFILLLFSLLNIQRNFDWKDDYTLWKDSASKTPNYAKPHLNMGLEYNKKGLNKLAVEEFKKAIEFLPDHAESYSKLGESYSDIQSQTHLKLAKVYSDLRNYKNAISEFLIAIEYDNDDYTALFSLGNAYSEIGQYEKAIDSFNKAALAYRSIWNKDYLDAIHNLGEVYGKMGKLSEAIKQFRKVLEIDPDHTLAKENLGRAHKYLESLDKTE